MENIPSPQRLTVPLYRGWKIEFSERRREQRPVKVERRNAPK